MKLIFVKLNVFKEKCKSIRKHIIITVGNAMIILYSINH